MADAVIQSINPATEALEASFAPHSDTDVDAALSAALHAQAQWAMRPVEERVPLLLRVASVLRSRKQRDAELITREMGKPLAEAVAEIEKCAVTCEFYAKAAVEFLADKPVASSASQSMVSFDPLGVVLAVMPWNYPFWQFVRFAAPALAAGNAAVLKHANNVPRCALALQEIFDEAGTPAGLVRTLLIESSRVAAIIEDPRIAAVTLTGSTDVGRQVAATAGRAMKKQVLELGGSDPFIVLADADLEKAAETAVKARFSNTGQSCISAKRFIVEEAVIAQFTDLFCQGVAKLRMGNPLDGDVMVGPMARGGLRDDLHRQVVRSVEAGARLRVGGSLPEGIGYFYPPTVLDNVTPEMAVATEETFGPVAAILSVRDAQAAIALANATEFGLGAAIWSQDVTRARQLAKGIQAGAVFINGLVASDARLPFGGVKQSGYGRELGEFGIREFTNIKTVWIGPAI